MWEEIERRSTKQKLADLELSNFNVMLQKDQNILIDSSSENDDTSQRKFVNTNTP